jgi:hypothetical protein
MPFDISLTFIEGCQLGAGDVAFGLLAVEARMHAGHEIDGIGHAQPARQDGDVGDEADVLHQVVALGARVEAQHRQLALERDQAQRRLQGGGLARAVRADQADDAAGRDLEARCRRRRCACRSAWSGPWRK